METFGIAFPMEPILFSSYSGERKVNLEVASVAPYITKNLISGLSLEIFLMYLSASFPPACVIYFNVEKFCFKKVVRLSKT